VSAWVINRWYRPGPFLTLELTNLGIDTKDKHSDELLKMAREQRNKLRIAQLKLH
jgi:hypothetical protein